MIDYIVIFFFFLDKFVSVNTLPCSLMLTSISISVSISVLCTTVQMPLHAGTSMIQRVCTHFVMFLHDITYK